MSFWYLVSRLEIFCRASLSWLLASFNWTFFSIASSNDDSRKSRLWVLLDSSV